MTTQSQKLAHILIRGLLTHISKERAARMETCLSCPIGQEIFCYTPKRAYQDEIGFVNLYWHGKPEDLHKFITLIYNTTKP